MDKELGSKLTYFETLQLLVEQQEELSVQKSHLHAAEAAVAAIRETRGQAEAEYRHALSDDLAKAEQKASGLGQDLIKAEQKTKLQLLTAPEEGVVQRWRLHGRRRCHAGAVGARGRATCHQRNRGDGVDRDIGFVHTDWKPRSRSTPSISPATAFCGQVLGVSQDAVIRDHQEDRATSVGWGRRNNSEAAGRG
jgi:hemolysin D